MVTNKITPVVRLVRETNNLLNRGEISPECAFRMISFAADGSEEPDAWALLARYYRNGIGCKRDEGMALYALRKSGKADWLLTPEDEPALGPEFGGCLMDEDEMYIERRDEDDLVDDFLDWDGNTVLAQYAEYDTANLGCSPDHPFVIPLPLSPRPAILGIRGLLVRDPAPRKIEKAGRAGRHRRIHHPGVKEFRPFPVLIHT